VAGMLPIRRWHSNPGPAMGADEFLPRVTSSQNEVVQAPPDSGGRPKEREDDADGRLALGNPYRNILLLRTVGGVSRYRGRERSPTIPAPDSMATRLQKGTPHFIIVLETARVNFLAAQACNLVDCSL